MKRYILFTYTTLLLLTLLGGCNKMGSQKTTARTYYESLDLSTPESAVDVFSKAFQKDDYPTVYLILSPSAQSIIANNINTLNYQRLIKLNDYADAKEILADTPQFQPVDQWEHRSGVYHFDSIMLAARKHAAFLIDLSGNVSILRSEPINNGAKVDVYATVEGIEGSVIFRMEQSPSGRWRVRQVIVPGGNEELIPWSVPNN